MEAQQYGVRVKKIRRYLGASAMSSTRCIIAQLADSSHFARDAANRMAIVTLQVRPIAGQKPRREGTEK
jgi:hypothetical protein